MQAIYTFPDNMDKKKWAAIGKQMIDQMNPNSLTATFSSNVEVY